MPSLIWDTKTPPSPVPGALQTDSIIYPHGAGYPDVTPQDRLIFGDNLAIMSALLADYEERVQLIYADPPFFTNKRYPARVGRGEDSRRPQDWQLAEGYQDHWPDIDAYLDMLYPRLQMMHRLLSPTGTLFLHLDWHANHYARLLLDEIFGPDQLLNEIVWVYHGPSPIRSAFNRKHDTILCYTKGEDYVFNVDDVREPYSPSTVKTFKSSRKAGFGKIPNLKRGKVPEDWWYFPVVARLHNERTGYPTQKPEALLERIILAASNAGDLVADFFCGSGTTPAVAARLGRRFIASDITWRAVHTSRSRLVDACQQPFELMLEHGARLDISPGNRDHLQRSQDSLSMNSQALEKIDYWEADPAWDGKVYRSAAQGVRPPGEESIASKLKLPVHTGDQPLCVRSVSVSGERFQTIL